MTPLLTIAIPTYKRAIYLDLCLSQLINQLKDKENLVELIISNNCSPDNTDEIVNKYITLGLKVKYIKNKTNIGPDNNFVQCFKVANGKYVVIFADDDILVEGSINKILRLLKIKEFGVVYIQPYGYMVDYKKEIPTRVQKTITIFNDRLKFFKAVYPGLNWISGVIFNKTKFDYSINPYSLSNTNLIQHSWVFSSILNSKYNAIYHEPLIAAKLENSGGFKFCRVYGQNFNKILNFFVKHGMPFNYKKVLNNKILFMSFPIWILRIRYYNYGFLQEDFFKELYPIYYHYILFWLLVFPIIKMPQVFVKIGSKLLKKVIELRNFGF
jgi:glycosyltransferase involved in cell wall biosynthesis